MACINDRLKLGLKILGVPVGKSYNNFYKCVAFFQLFNSTLVAILVITYCFSDNPLAKKLIAIQTSCTVFHTVPKLYDLILNNDKFNGLLKELDSLWEQGIYDQKRKDLVMKDSSKFFTIFTTVSMTMIFSGDLLSAFQKLAFGLNVLPYQLLLPFDDEEYYWIALFINVISIPMPVLSICISTPVYYTITKQIVEHLRILKDMVSRPDADLKKCIQYHKNIIQFNKNFNDYWGFHLFNEVICSSLQACTATMVIGHAVKIREAGIISHIMRGALIYFMAFNLCYIPQQITNESEELMVAIYNRDWESEKSIKARKTILQMLTGSCRSLTLSCKGVFNADMVTFTAMVRGTYTCFTALQLIDVDIS